MKKETRGGIFLGTKFERISSCGRGDTKEVRTDRVVAAADQHGNKGKAIH